MNIQVIMKENGNIVVKDDSREYLILEYHQEGYKVGMSTALPTDYNQAEELVSAYKKAFQLSRGE